MFVSGKQKNSNLQLVWLALGESIFNCNHLKDISEKRRRVFRLKKVRPVQTPNFSWAEPKLPNYLDRLNWFRRRSQFQLNYVQKAKNALFDQFAYKIRYNNLWIRFGTWKVQSRSKGEIPIWARRKERLSRSKLKQAFLIDSDAELFIYLIQCIRFGSWKFDVWTESELNENILMS